MMDRSIRRGLLFAFVLAAVGCSLSTGDSDPAAQVQEALGEPMNGFPSADERLMFMAINRGRSDPATIKGPLSTVYPARPPVLWNYDLSRSSRFHATNLVSADVGLMHTSPCTLKTDVGTSGCDGSVACACASPVPTACAACATEPAVNTCGTAPFSRIAYFSKLATGEVAAAGYADTFATVAGWLDEPAGADGHRTNLLDQGIKSNVMGAGHATGMACFRTFDVSDSGMMPGLTLPPLPSASVQPVSGHAGATYTFYATWADATGGAPRSLNVVVDGRCVPLAQERGTPTLNSTWAATQMLPAGCHNYYYLATDSHGNSLQYPTVGSLLIPVDVPCSSDYQPTAPAASCASPDGGASGAGANEAGAAVADASMDRSAAVIAVDAAAARDAAMTPPRADAAIARGEGGAGGPDAATPGPDTSTAAFADGGALGDEGGAALAVDASSGAGAETASAGCGCHAVATDRTPVGVGALLAALVALRRRKPTRCDDDGLL